MSIPCKFYQIGGQSRPVRFGMAALYVFERHCKRSMSELAVLSDGATDAPYGLLVDLIYAGMVCGAQSKGLKVDFEPYDVADWVNDPELLPELMQHFGESFEQKKTTTTEAIVAEK